MKFQFNDGGRTAAGYTGPAGDCVCRAIAIAAERPYREVYDALAEGCATERRTRRSGKVSGRRTAAMGVHTTRKWFKDYMVSLGFRWVPTMRVGQGCKVHLAAGELPMGRLVVAVSKHYTAVIDGVIHDTYNPQREPFAIFSGNQVLREDGTLGNEIVRMQGGRCVYGYWVKA